MDFEVFLKDFWWILKNFLMDSIGFFRILSEYQMNEYEYL